MDASIRQVILYGLIFCVTACGAPNAYQSTINQDGLYENALRDSAIIEADEIIDLPIIHDKTVRVVTWTNYVESYPVGKLIDMHWADVWVTLDGDVKNRCSQFNRETLFADTQKLLGLPLAADVGRSFVVLEVSSSALFRPCADPSLTASRCTAAMPENTNVQHKAWFATQAATAYQAEKGYPWTRLGYTYNWKSGESEIGVAEFVVRQGSNALVKSADKTESYCSRN